MTQAIVKNPEEELQVKKKESKFNNFLLDSLYNIIAYIPAAIITWFISNIDFWLLTMIKEEDYKELLERVFQQKMEELFEEPSTYEDEEDE